MTKSIKIIIAMLALGLWAGFGSVQIAQAAGNLEVEFERTPLFSETNLAPGQSVSRWVRVKNLSTETRRVITEAANISDPVEFSRQLTLEIGRSGQVLFTGSLHDYLAGQEIYLFDLGGGAEEILTMTVTFDSTVEDGRQSRDLGFDIVIGLAGEEGSTSGGEAPGGGGAGSSGGYRVLMISNEASVLTEPPAEEQVWISWQTNYPATSQVIYGLAGGGPYPLDLAAPNYGYPQASVEDGTKVTDHNVWLNGLIPGQTYNYRVVSHASPATIGLEHTFTVPQRRLAVLGPNGAITDSGQPIGNLTAGLIATTATG